MEAEEVKNSPSSFTTLSDWDFSAPCARAGCNGKVRSNVLFRKGGKTRRCYCGEVQDKLHLYDKKEDNSNLFHTVSEWVAGEHTQGSVQSQIQGQLRIHSHSRG